jgi:hypothetical protein
MDAAALSTVGSGVDYRAQPISVAAADQTALPVAQAIGAAANDAGGDGRWTGKSTAGISRDAIIDPQTNAVVFRSFDVSTGIVIEQVPAQAVLRQRAYVDAQTVRALIAGKALTEAVLAAGEGVDITT